MPSTDNVDASVTGPMVAAGAIGASPRTCPESDDTTKRLANAHEASVRGMNALGTAVPQLSEEKRGPAL